jgi:putative FmdB family regulatory protein
MPTYEYVCKQCGHLFEIVQSMRDDPLTECPECGGELRKVFAPPAISFKGSGFYATDHGKKATKPAGEKGDTGEKGEKGDKGEKGESKKETASDGAKEPKKDSASGDSNAASTSPTPSGGKSAGTGGSGS